ncbi:MAG: hypothetical protein H0W73_01155 [Bacteroidetes bacterium]|nr:hypothetical protein [Bacteroidota bacterium]
MQNITVAFYNVENFFDTIDDPETQDEEFLPTSLSEWDETKYLNKIKRVAQVLDSTVDGVNLPDAVGFCEVENKNVLNDLIFKSNLKTRKYISICSTGMDTRGINVGFIFDTSIFDLMDSEEIKVVNDLLPYYATRNILHITLKFKTTGEPIHFFVNHWPSRRDGEMETEAKRIYAAQILRNKINELHQKDPEVKLIIMGDLNDSPKSRSIVSALMANGSPKSGSRELFNPYFELYTQKKGSHYRQGVWELFDNIILSQGFLNDEGLHFKKGNAFIHDKDFVLFKNHSTGEFKPNRTYGDNNKYFNGFSDHLAVYVKLGY